MTEEIKYISIPLPNLLDIESDGPSVILTLRYSRPDSAIAAMRAGADLAIALADDVEEFRSGMQNR